MKKFVILVATLLCLLPVFSSAAENLALHRPVMVSSTTPDKDFKGWGWHKTFINDGNLTTGWTSDVQTNPTADEAEWVRVYLENLYTVDTVILRNISALPGDIEVLLSEDGTWFHPVAHKTTGSFPVHEDLTITFDAEVASAVMVRGTDLLPSGTDGYLMQIAELEVYGEAYIPTEGEKLKIQNVVSSTSYEQPSENWSRAMVADGNLATGWTSVQGRYPSTQYCSEWIHLDLGAEYELSYITLIHPNNQYYAADFNIAVSTDGVMFTTIASRYDANPHPNEVMYFSALGLNARYIRYTCSKFGNPSYPIDSDGYMVQISEIAAFGKSTNPTRLRVNKTHLSMAPRDTEAIKPSYADGNKGVFTYTSSNTAVASVTTDGVVRAIAPGYAEITVSGNRDSQTATTVVYVEEKEKNILITAFWPPTPGYTNGTQYNLMREAHFDSYEGNDLLQSDGEIFKSAFFAYENGLAFDAVLPGMNYTADSVATIKSKLSPYTNIPGIGGIHIIDEPFDPMPYVNAYHAIREADPSWTATLNFLPGQAYSSYTEYQRVMHEWARATDYDSVISFDNYPFPDNSTGVVEQQLLDNFESNRNVAVINGKLGSAFYAQSTGKPTGFRWLNREELRYHVYLALAYGIKQVKYFTYFLPTGRSEDFYGAIVDQNGVPTSRYAMVQEINETVLGLGRVLYNTYPAHVFQNGSYSANMATPIPSSFFVKPKDSNRLVISLHKDKDTNRNYLMIVNKNYQSSVTSSFTVNGVSSMEKIHPTMGVAQATNDFSNGTLTITLEAGGCALYALNEGFDFDPQTLSYETNLARHGIVKTSGSTLNAAWDVFNLNDGITHPTAGSAGWYYSSGATDTAFISVDLRSEKTFNCVELFPDGSGNTVGQGYPTGIRILVSNDTKTWNEVYVEKNLDKPTTKALRYYFESTTARYIKLVFDKPAARIAFGEIAIYEKGEDVPEQQTNYSTSYNYTFGENIAKGKALAGYSSMYTASDSGWHPSCINDGIVGDNAKPGWTSNVNSNFDNHEEWIAIDLGNLYKLDKVVIYPRLAGVGFPTDYIVEVSENGIDFTPVITVTGDTDESYHARTHTITPTTTRFIKLRGTKLKIVGSDGYLMQIDELEAYGTPYSTELVDSYSRDFTDSLGQYNTHSNFFNSGCVPFTVSRGVAVPGDKNSQIFYAADFPGADMIEFVMDVKAPNLGNEPGLYLSLFDNHGYHWATNMDYLWLGLRGNSLSLRNHAEWEKGENVHASVSIEPYDFSSEMQKLSVQMDLATKTATVYIYDNGHKVKIATVDASNQNHITLTSATTNETVAVSQVKNISIAEVKLNLWAYDVQDTCSIDNLSVYGYRLQSGATDKALFFVKGVKNLNDDVPLRSEKLFRTKTIEVLVHSEGGEKGFLTLAFYSEDGRLLHVKTLKDGNFNQGENSYTVDIPQTQEPIAAVKALLWNGSDTLSTFDTYYQIP